MVAFIFSLNVVFWPFIHFLENDLALFREIVAMDYEIVCVCYDYVGPIRPRCRLIPRVWITWLLAGGQQAAEGGSATSFIAQGNESKLWHVLDDREYRPGALDVKRRLYYTFLRERFNAVFNNPTDISGGSQWFPADPTTSAVTNGISNNRETYGFLTAIAAAIEAAREFLIETFKRNRQSPQGVSKTFKRASPLPCFLFTTQTLILHVLVCLFLLNLNFRKWDSNHSGRERSAIFVNLDEISSLMIVDNLVSKNLGNIIVELP
ncbi:uncharacterized protein BDR25DRAFT_356392 [Lindgomyces ingoldianus]|uniref:Uncharacterized protein n=1 Tax=Lindgomyces ingoldianus TaxID=673940 RepID=A0ACB6QRX5_9PLEO|nr:uncharacterized protein BDR25DRAFT_356392 [Lindgomyces ingoldianus]KAF2469646.1 hypothetical protein BDR25DRAFT_356392 [Lindgomyces ingoldianus]